MARPLTPDEEEVAALLHRAGLSRVAARCFAALLRGAPLRRSDLADASGLSPQDVSVAARELEAIGLSVSEDVVDGARGRPAKRYRLAYEARTGVARFVAQRRAALLRESEALDALVARFSA